MCPPELASTCPRPTTPQSLHTLKCLPTTATLYSFSAPHATLPWGILPPARHAGGLGKLLPAAATSGPVPAPGSPIQASSSSGISRQKLLLIVGGKQPLPSAATGQLLLRLPGAHATPGYHSSLSPPSLGCPAPALHFHHCCTGQPRASSDRDAGQLGTEWVLGRCTQNCLAEVRGRGHFYPLCRATVSAQCHHCCCCSAQMGKPGEGARHDFLL